MKRQPNTVLKEYYIYTPYFHAVSYHSETDSDDDTYNEIIYYDGGDLDDIDQVIYDGGGVEGYGN